MNTQDFTVINNLTIGVTAVAFSKNETLIAQLQNMGFNKLLINEKGPYYNLLLATNGRWGSSTLVKNNEVLT